MDLQEFRLSRGGLALSIHQINEFEEKDQLKLPPDYREIVLKQFNGGRPEGALTKGTYYTVTTKIKKVLKNMT